MHRPSAISTVTVACAIGLALAGCGSGPSSPSPAVASPTPTNGASLAPSGTSPGASPTSGAASPSSSAASPSFDPANFATTIDNPWYPLAPGTTFTYEGKQEDESVVDVFAVTDKTILIEGVTCVIVDDRLSVDGVLAEKTFDYFAQDRDGNVWYLGEDTHELDDNGKVTSTEGTWRAGVDGAQPGIFMEATPTIGHTFAQEIYVGHAEDHFEVISLSEAVTVPFGSFQDVLLTHEWTPLEPDVVGGKEYAKGVGLIKEFTVKGPSEELSLVSIDR